MTHNIDDHAEVRRISIKPPPFYYGNVPVWFQQLESQFVLANISNDVTKFHHAWAVFPEDIAVSIPQNLAEKQSYVGLRDFLISSRQKSSSELMEQALAEYTKGDERPSELFQKIQRAMDDAKIIDTKILQFKFLRSLPDAMRISLACQIDKTLPELVKIADLIHEQTGRTVHAINTTENSEIMNAIEGLRAEINLLKRRNTASIETANYCYYHATYGSRAKKCKPLPDGSRCLYKPAGNARVLPN